MPRSSSCDRTRQPTRPATCQARRAGAGPRAVRRAFLFRRPPWARGGKYFLCENITHWSAPPRIWEQVKIACDFLFPGDIPFLAHAALKGSRTWLPSSPSSALRAHLRNLDIFAYTSRVKNSHVSCSRGGGPADPYMSGVCSTVLPPVGRDCRFFPQLPRAHPTTHPIAGTP